MLSRALTQRVLRDGLLGRTVLARSSSTSSVPLDFDSTEILSPISKTNQEDQKISRAMKAYLERATAHEKFMNEENRQFALGKRHLANMMGWDHDDISQADIDKAINYLMPSGLFDVRARPVLRPPEEIFPKQKTAEFDKTGRPYHYLFYTVKPNFYQLMHKCVSELKKCDERLDNFLSVSEKDVPPASAAHPSEVGRWCSKEIVEQMCTEKISDELYDYLIRVLERLINHPFSAGCTDFIKKFRIVAEVGIGQDEVEPLQYDADGVPYSSAIGIRKTARAIVTVRGRGSGKVILNGSLSIADYFPMLKERTSIMYPMHFLGLLNKFDVEVTLYKRFDEYFNGRIARMSPEELLDLRKELALGEGTMCEAGAIRTGIAKAIRSFVTPEEIEHMRLAGLLTRDPRRRERKKPGQEGARRKYTWLKR